MYTPWTPPINIDWFAASAAMAYVDIDKAVKAAVDANIKGVGDSFRDLTTAIAAKGLYFAKWGAEYLAANTAMIKARLALGSTTAQHEINLFESYLVQRQDAENKTQIERIEALETSIVEKFTDAVVEIKDIVTLDHDAISDTVKDATDEVVEEAGTLLGKGLNSLIPVISNLATDFGMALSAGIIGAEVEGGEAMGAMIDKVRATEGIPEEILPILDKAKEPKGLIGLLILSSFLGPLFYPILSALYSPITVPITYTMNKAALPYRFDPGTITRLYLREYKVEGELKEFFGDLEDLGWDKDRIDALKELSNIIPPLADMVRFADFSAFDEEVIAAWREFYDAPNWIKEPFSLLGVTGEWANKYWFSHWIQPGRYELGELHRRNLVDDDGVKLAYRTMGYSSYWQDLLLKLVREIPTRVDVRRWWDMGTIDEARLQEIYHAHGYYDQDLDDYVLWTKVYVAFPDLVAQYKNGWIGEQEVKDTLTGLGMPEDRMLELWQTKFKKAVSVERVVKERDLTKAEIYKGVKKGVLTRPEGQTFLEDMGYDEYEAWFILAINVPEDTEDTAVKYRDLTKTDVLKALKKRVITEAEALDRLLTLRYTPDDAELILRIYIASIAPPPEIELRQESKADIIKAVKKGLITHEDGYLRLLDIGFSGDASTFILSVYVEVEPFSPTTPSEFKALINQYKKAQGMEVEDISPEVIEAERNLLNLQKRIEVATQRGDLALLDTLEPQFAEAQVKLRELIILSQASH